MKPYDAIAAAWNVQNGEKVYQMNFGASHIDGIMLAIKEAGFVIVPRDPTPAMLNALNECGGDTDSIWPKMIEAADGK